jgi:aspartate-semialdehyde dehydrogenase
MPKISVAILGATGTVGSQFLNLLQNHPWFEVTHLMASSNSAGHKYGELMEKRWKLESHLPEKYRNIVVQDVNDVIPNVEIAFSALDSNVAGEIEIKYAAAGIGVFSNSKNHRIHPEVPIIIPEINPNHFESIKTQSFDKKNKGFIVTNPNCSLQAGALSLFPIYESFGLEKVFIITMQALSGAGYPGVPSLDILGNVVPHIDEEEKKIETETLKIFGSFDSDGFTDANISISAMCNRVPVVNGHICSISFETKTKVSKREILELWKNWKPDIFELGLPSYQNPLQYFSQPDRPQPRLDQNLGNGMTVSVGNLRECNLFDYKYQSLVNNTVRGAAGGAILNAEYWAVQNI